MAAGLLLAFCCGAGLGSAADRPAAEYGMSADSLPPGVQLFDLHDPGLLTNWPGFLATTRMLNDELLPPSLQERLANVVATYRSLTPADRPAFFVATYFDVLSERLLAADTSAGEEILPMEVCPVFASGADASVTSLLAVASGLPDELFIHAPGAAERYRYLFLQTEFSHCRFLASIQASSARRLPVTPGAAEDKANTRLSFVVGERNYSATLSTREELRALLETIGEIDATSMFRRVKADRDGVDGTSLDEAQVLGFIRLLSLLATDGKSGYAAIPVLFPLLSGNQDELHSAENAPLHIADALHVAYQAREEFRRLAAFPIRDPADLLRAKRIVMQALAEGSISQTTDARVMSLLSRFVTGADLLLATSMAPEAIAQ